MEVFRPRAHTVDWFDDLLRATARRAGRGRSLTREEAARRTAAAVAKLDWQWPFWLDRQLRPAHAAFVPVGDVASIENLTGRTWSTVGTIAMGALAMVDPTGFVTPASGQWGIDWIVQAGDRWLVPAREAAVRQRTIDDQPVIETVLRIPDGDAIQRVFAVPGEREFGDVVVIEIENTSPIPIAVGIVVRPADLTSVGVIDALEFDGALIRINEQPALVLPRPPSAHRSGHAALGDAIALLAHEQDEQGATTDSPRRVTCALGLANGVAVFPLPHRAKLRCYLAPRAPRRSVPRQPDRVPEAGAVARGWRAHLDTAATMSVPDDALVRSYRCAVRRLLLAFDGADVTAPGGQVWSVADEATAVSALSRIGLGAHVAPLLAERMDDQRIDGWARRGDASMARNLAALECVVTHWRATRDAVVAQSLLVPAVRMAQWCGRRVERNADIRAAAVLAPLVAAMGDMARALGQHDTGSEIDEFGATIEWHSARGRETEVDADVDGDAAAAEDDLVPTRRGIDLNAVTDRARSDIEAGAVAGVIRLQTVAGHLSDAGSWPSFVHPRLGTGSGGLGDDPLVCARVVEAMRNVVVLERVIGRELQLLPVLPSAWRGQAIDVAGVPTFGGHLSYSVRWHGSHAALIWELDAPVGGDVRLSAPGLSQEWSTTLRSGEALLVQHEP
jgi:hypothetical protein